MEIQFNASAAAGLVSGLAMLGLGVAVFATGPGKPLRRSFALLMVVLGINGLLLPFGIFGTVLGSVRDYLGLARPAALLYFVWCVWDHFHGPGTSLARRLARLVVPWALLALTAFVEVVYALDHRSLYNYDRATGQGHYGWLTVISALHFPLLLAPVFLFLHQWRLSGGAVSAWHRLALAFLLGGSFYPLATVMSRLLPYVPGRTPYGPTTGYGFVQDAYLFCAALLAVGGVAVMVWTARRIGTPESRTAAKRSVIAWGVLVVSVIASRIVFQFRLGEYFAWPHFVFLAAWTLMLPLLALGPVLHERLLDVSAMVRVTISRAALVSFFAAVAFVSVEMLANFLSDTISFGVGMAAAALLLLVLHPLQRFADRVSRGTVPEGRPVSEMSANERRRLYEEQARLAWMDGNLQRKERLLLDALRDRLGLSVSEAAELERRAVA